MINENDYNRIMNLNGDYHIINDELAFYGEIDNDNFYLEIARIDDESWNRVIECYYGDTLADLNDKIDRAKDVVRQYSEYGSSLFSLDKIKVVE